MNDVGMLYDIIKKEYLTRVCHDIEYENQYRLEDDMLILHANYKDKYCDLEFEYYTNDFTIPISNIKKKIDE
jgi:hypothetical protein